jgi:ABC-type transporter Mla maintaining outer membrane lipid asymmetry ATPase subunit MlaF
MSNEPAIDVRGVAKPFGPSSVLHDINLEVLDGELCAPRRGSA